MKSGACAVAGAGHHDDFGPVAEALYVYVALASSFVFVPAIAVLTGSRFSDDCFAVTAGPSTRARITGLTACAHQAVGPLHIACVAKCRRG